MTNLGCREVATSGASGPARPGERRAPARVPESTHAGRGAKRTGTPEATAVEKRAVGEPTEKEPTEKELTENTENERAVRGGAPTARRPLGPGRVGEGGAR